MECCLNDDLLTNLAQRALVGSYLPAFAMVSRSFRKAALWSVVPCVGDKWVLCYRMSGYIGAVPEAP